MLMKKDPWIFGLILICVLPASQSWKDLHSVSVAVIHVKQKPSLLNYRSLPHDGVDLEASFLNTDLGI